MNFEVSRIKIDEVEISVKNILAQCMRKWKLTIVMAIVFAILITGFMYVRDVFTYNAVLTGELTEAQKKEWTETDQVAVDTFRVVQQKVEQLEAYRENSIYVNLDFNNINSGVLTYQVDAEDVIKYDITSAIASYVTDGALAKELSEKEGYPEAKYIQEILTANVAGTPTGIESGIVTISVVGASEADCAKYVSDIKNAVNGYYKTLKTDVQNFNLNTIEETYVIKSVKDVYTKQQEYLAECTTIQLDYVNKLSALTDVQKAYIVSQNVGEEIDFEEKLQVSKPKVKPLFIVVGAVVGVFVAIVAVICITIFGGKLQSDKELLRRFNISHLGNVYVLKKDVIEKWIHKLLYKKESLDAGVQMEQIATRLNVILKEDTNKKVCIIGTPKCFDAQIVIEWANAIQKHGIECSVVGNIYDAKNGMMSLPANTKVVLVETVGRSRITDVYEEAMLCADAKVNVIGYISVYA